nr:hypothetical protein [Tanacetum cinerariifolium]
MKLKWLWKNKKDEDQTVIRNKERLVAKGYAQEEEAESSSHNIGNSNVPTFNQPQDSKYRWIKDHPLEQVHGNASRPVQTRRQLATYPEICMYALTVSTAEPKNIKEAMADSAWIEAMPRSSMKKASDYDNPDPVPQRQDVSSSADVDVPSLQESDLLFGPLYDEFFNAEAESSSHNIGNSNVPTFNQPQDSKYRWIKDHPLEQVHGNASRPVQTRRQLATYPEICMYALTVSTAEPKNIKEAMADSAWIEAM